MVPVPQSRHIRVSGSIPSVKKYLVTCFTGG
jgi:hypothetical protein